MFVHLLARFPRPPGPVTSGNVKINHLIFSKDTHKTTSTVKKWPHTEANQTGQFLTPSSVPDVEQLYEGTLRLALQRFRCAKHCVNEHKSRSTIAMQVLIVPLSLIGKLRLHLACEGVFYQDNTFIIEDHTYLVTLNPLSIVRNQQSGIWRTCVQEIPRSFLGELSLRSFGDVCSFNVVSGCNWQEHAHQAVGLDKIPLPTKHVSTCCVLVSPRAMVWPRSLYWEIDTHGGKGVFAHKTLGLVPMA